MFCDQGCLVHMAYGMLDVGCWRPKCDQGVNTCTSRVRTTVIIVRLMVNIYYEWYVVL